MCSLLRIGKSNYDKTISIFNIFQLKEVAISNSIFANGNRMSILDGSENQDLRQTGLLVDREATTLLETVLGYLLPLDACLAFVKIFAIKHSFFTTGSGFYIFTDVLPDSPEPNTMYRIMSPLLPRSKIEKGKILTLEFFYHMFGSGIGNLNIYIIGK